MRPGRLPRNAPNIPLFQLPILLQNYITEYQNHSCPYTTWPLLECLINYVLAPRIFCWRMKFGAPWGLLWGDGTVDITSEVQ